MKNVKNSARISDVGPLLTTGTTGFTVRKRTGVGMVVHFFLLGCMVILGASLLVYYKSPEGCVLAVVIGACFAMVSNNLEKLKKVKQSLEFMNALFSSALGKSYQFCCIVKASGEIIFYNRSFQSVFPSFMTQANRSIDTLLELYQVPQDQREKLKALMAANIEGAVATTLSETGASSSLSITFQLEPIDRPTGFFLLRGK